MPSQPTGAFNNNDLTLAYVQNNAFRRSFKTITNLKCAAVGRGMPSRHRGRLFMNQTLIEEKLPSCTATFSQCPKLPMNRSTKILAQVFAIAFYVGLTVLRSSGVRIQSMPLDGWLFPTEFNKACVIAPNKLNAS